PTEGTVSVEANNSGRQRRSKRIRGGAGGASWSILANSDDSIYVLKTKIYEEIDAYPIRQRLYFKGNVLEDRLSLKDCGIKVGDAIFVRLSEDIPDETSIGDDALEREVGFEDSVFLRHNSSNGSSHHHAGMTLESKVWVCPACTYVNEDIDQVCEMCTTEKTIEID
uniref:Ubiquitin-like domain-containing protein n=1 Tax=Globisporangium ultimum (strain ATCC 200006 / CBS 805.95 / DAOM BR144) TaxID=431595 RepID=K3WLH0_GLOUD